METVFKHPVSLGFRTLFMAVTPNESSFEKLEDVPNYVQDASPYFFAMVFLEMLVLYIQGKPLPRMNDSFGSVANGVLSVLDGLLFRGTKILAYIWMYERYNIVQLPWESPWTWLVCLIGVDFGYYWLHRGGHEINLLWSGHQVHHSSEEYNLSTALRQSAILDYFTWVASRGLEKGELFTLYQTIHRLFFYMPLALFIPPSVFMVHVQFNLLYQFWIHTETIDKLGPLEWILSTPSHHRVHHGRNPYCIDKNYGGIFIVWDRLFGTFEAEKEEEKVVYGLVHNIDTWEPIYAQLFHLKYVIQAAWKIEGFSNKVSVLCKGPGWGPGKPRLGLPEEIPKIEPNPQKYDSNLPLWNSVYIWVHFILIFAAWHPSLGIFKRSLSSWSMILNIAYIVWSLSLFGRMYDKQRNTDLQEMLRCVVFIMWTSLSNDVPLGQYFLWLYVPSAILWAGIVASGGARSEAEKKLK